MGSSMRKKRRAKPSGSTVKVGRVKKTKQHVKVVPVLLPGARDATSWDDDDTHQNNYESVGIVSDPNKVGKTGRNAAKRIAEDRDGEAARDDAGPTASRAGAKTKTTRDDTVAAQAVVGGDEVRGALGQVRSTGEAPPKRLTTKQRRIVGALVAKHGADLNAMARDRKLNAMQHTVAQLRNLVVSLMAYPELLEEGGGKLGFRAPIKSSLKGRNKVR
jgi:nucleolar protein 16